MKKKPFYSHFFRFTSFQFDDDDDDISIQIAIQHQCLEMCLITDRFNDGPEDIVIIIAVARNIKSIHSTMRKKSEKVKHYLILFVQ